jgi:hypothetical protein
MHAINRTMRYARQFNVALVSLRYSLPMEQNHQTAGSGFTGSLKLLAIVAILAVATLAVLMVLGAIQPAAFSDMVTKIGMLAGIGAATIVAIWALSR